MREQGGPIRDHQPIYENEGIEARVNFPRPIRDIPPISSYGKVNDPMYYQDPYGYLATWEEQYQAAKEANR